MYDRLFQNITTGGGGGGGGGGCKSLIVLCSLGKFANRKYPFGLESSPSVILIIMMNESMVFSSDCVKISLKAYQALENSNLWTYPVELYSFKEGLEYLHPLPCMDRKWNGLIMCSSILSKALQVHLME